ncbi:MAG: Trk family potassium uptake protein [Ruminococcaceae bacterium]|nr:Trk family potassium uptake protein [Oscillospiraceae bacterium]
MLEKLREKFTYTQTIVLSFALLTLIGAALLTLPIASASGSVTPILNTIFTSTSAISGAGLVIYDTYSQWSLFGRIVILILIQIGNLGFIIVISMFSLFLRKRIGIYERRVLMQSEGTLRLSGVVKLLKRIFFVTFIVEGIGAAILAIRYCSEFGVGPGIELSIFHSVSAFCNAGFDLMGIREPFSSLTSYHDDPLVCVTLIVLIIIGGLGFLVWDDMINHKFDFQKYSLHSKLVFATNFILFVGGALLFLIFEDKNLFDGLPIWEKVLKAFFTSVTPRNAGFTILDCSQFSQGSEMLTDLLMFIGAGSGSTGGGIKVTTVAVLFVFTLAAARNNTHPQVFKRSIPTGTLKQAVAILIIYITAVFTATAIICTVDNFPITDTIFETISAISTSGLSKGLTTELSGVSKLVIIALMFGGRVGGLTLVLTLAEKKVNAPVDRPQENVIVG